MPFYCLLQAEKRMPEMFTPLPETKKIFLLSARKSKNTLTMKSKLLILFCSLFLLAGCKVGFPIENTSNYSSGKCRTVQCYAKTKAGNRCKNMTSNCSGRCHVH